MKKEKSEEKETLEVNKLITKKEKIKDNIVDIIDIEMTKRQRSLNSLVENW